MPPQALAFFNTLTDAQRDMLASMSGLTENERSELGDALVEAAIASQSSGDAKSGLEKLRAAGGTGPAVVAFGERAVVHRYMSQQQLERIAARLMSYPTADEREAETVKAMRRFIACDQPLFEVRLVDCPVRHNRAPKVDLNGLKARMDVMSSMPGGTPERYNVGVKLPSSGGGGGGGGDDADYDDACHSYHNPLPTTTTNRAGLHRWAATRRGLQQRAYRPTLNGARSRTMTLWLRSTSRRSRKRCLASLMLRVHRCPSCPRRPSKF